MKYINATKQDIQMNLPKTMPVQWVVVKVGETEDIDVDVAYAKRFGLLTNDTLKEMAMEEKVEKERVEAEESKIGEVVGETKKIAKTQGSKELPGVPNDITEEEAKKADLEYSKKEAEIKKKTSERESKK